MGKIIILLALVYIGTLTTFYWMNIDSKSTIKKDGSIFSLETGDNWFDYRRDFATYRMMFNNKLLATVEYVLTGENAPWQYDVATIVYRNDHNTTHAAMMISFDFVASDSSCLNTDKQMLDMKTTEGSVYTCQISVETSPSGKAKIFVYPGSPNKSVEVWVDGKTYETYSQEIDQMLKTATYTKKN